jgi:hypothetical protein
MVEEHAHAQRLVQSVPHMHVRDGGLGIAGVKGSLDLRRPAGELMPPLMRTARVDGSRAGLTRQQGRAYRPGSWKPL